MINFSSKSTYLFSYLLWAFQPQNVQIMTPLIMKEIMKILMTMMMMGMKNKRDDEEIMKIIAMAVTVNIIMTLRSKKMGGRKQE